MKNKTRNKFLTGVMVVMSIGAIVSFVWLMIIITDPEYVRQCWNCIK